MDKIQSLSFPINRWNHLYSLQQAITHNNQRSGRELSLTGRVLNADFLNNKDSDITIHFHQVIEPPSYPALSSEETVNEIPLILGTMNYADQQLTTTIDVGQAVFEELRKNVMEYGEIEGIHIVISFSVVAQSEHWQVNQSLPLIELDYAMKGDG